MYLDKILGAGTTASLGLLPKSSVPLSLIIKCKLLFCIFGKGWLPTISGESPSRIIGLIIGKICSSKYLFAHSL